MPAPILDFYHDTVCCWCFNMSGRLRILAREMPLDIHHHTFVLQASTAEMRDRWGSPDEARATILGHWQSCRARSDRPEAIDIDAMGKAGFDYPHGMVAALACKAAEGMEGQAAHWDMFDRIQTAHLSEALNIADTDVLDALAMEIGLSLCGFRAARRDPATAEAVAADRAQARKMDVRMIPALIVRSTGQRIENLPLDGLRDALHSALARVA